MHVHPDDPYDPFRSCKLVIIQILDLANMLHYRNYNQEVPFPNNNCFGMPVSLIFMILQPTVNISEHQIPPCQMMACISFDKTRPVRLAGWPVVQIITIDCARIHKSNRDGRRGFILCS
jgi:hypothetical protein